MKKLDIILNKIEKLCNPVSIFLYGSRARTDFLKRSDYEIGVLMRKNKYVGRSKIKETISENGFNIYPFKYEDFVKGKLETPFEKSIYLREIKDIFTNISFLNEFMNRKLLTISKRTETRF